MFVLSSNENSTKSISTMQETQTVPSHLRIELKDTGKYQFFTDGSRTKYKSVSAIKKTLSDADFDTIKKMLAERRGVDIQVIEDEWAMGRERGELVDEIADFLLSGLQISPSVLLEKYNKYNSFTEGDCLKIADEFKKFSKFIDRIGTRCFTQYLCSCTVNIDGKPSGFGFATKGDLAVIDEVKKEVYFFDVKADKEISKAGFNGKKLLGAMRPYDDCNQNQYFFQVVCSWLCLIKTGGIKHNDTWIDLSRYTFKGGGIIHWNMNFKKFFLYPLPVEGMELFKNYSARFISDYFKNLKTNG
jgi:hypothetical protein